ncbi:MAG: enoyl-CoA hydratase/isomerase family protein, partial [Sulfolobus sp.]|nr:enoyl-CoA hydratase/isomerase family protein [Sulfolobus sp.]
ELLAANASKEKASMLARYLYEIYKKLIDLEKLKIAVIKGLIMNEGIDFLLGMDLIIAKPETYLFDIRSSIGLNSPLLNTLGPFIFPISFIKKF